MTFRRRFVRSIPVLTVMGIIFFLSHLPGSSIQLPQLPGVDKLGHALLYGILAAAALFAWSPVPSDRAATLRAGAVMVLFCLLYGISDEFHQSFVPGRDSSAGDLLADTAGAFLAVVLWGLIRAPRHGGDA